MGVTRTVRMLFALSENVGSWIVVVMLSAAVIYIVASAKAKDRAERRVRVMDEMTRRAENRAKARAMDEIYQTAIDPVETVDE